MCSIFTGFMHLQCSEVFFFFSLHLQILHFLFDWKINCKFIAQIEYATRSYSVATVLFWWLSFSNWMGLERVSSVANSDRKSESAEHLTWKKNEAPLEHVFEILDIFLSTPFFILAKMVYQFWCIYWWSLYTNFGRLWKKQFLQLKMDISWIKNHEFIWRNQLNEDSFF